MARTLLVVRHAKAIRDGVADRDRRLAPRGILDARAAGRWLVEHDLLPDRVMVSPSRRTTETWEAMMSAVAVAPAVVSDDRVYANTVESLLDVVHESPDDAHRLAVVGHNPSIHAFALTLDDGRGDEPARTRLAEAFPTAGIAVLDVDVDWARLEPATATVRAFAVPRG